MSALGIILIVLILVVCLGGFGGYHYGWASSSPYYAPGFGLVGVVLVVLLVLMLMGRF
jgi:hypothetical protein